MKLRKIVQNQYLITLFLATVLFTGSIPLFCSHNPPLQVEMAEKWQKKEIELPSTLDPQIKNAVIVLNLLEIETVASSEGSLDHGAVYPWIEIRTDETPVLEAAEKLAKVTEEIEKAHREGETEIKELLRKHRALYEAYENAVQLQIYPLYKLLNEFYKTPRNYDATLILNPMDRIGHYRLQSRGGVYQDVRTPEEKEQKLLQYREEMMTFTRFLVKKFQRGNT